MTLLVNLDADSEELLNAKAQEAGGDAATIAALLLADALREHATDSDTDLTDEEWETIQAGIQRSETDVGASSR